LAPDKNKINKEIFMRELKNCYGRHIWREAISSTNSR
jgi:hypothetical protein